jgi:hypothetical protein
MVSSWIVGPPASLAGLLSEPRMATGQIDTMADRIPADFILEFEAAHFSYNSVTWEATRGWLTQAERRRPKYRRSGPAADLIAVCQELICRRLHHAPVRVIATRL